MIEVFALLIKFNYAIASFWIWNRVRPLCRRTDISQRNCIQMEITSIRSYYFSIIHFGYSTPRTRKKGARLWSSNVYAYQFHRRRSQFICRSTNLLVFVSVGLPIITSVWFLREEKLFGSVSKAISARMYVEYTYVLFCFGVHVLFYFHFTEEKLPNMVGCHGFHW